MPSASLPTSKPAKNNLARPEPARPISIPKPKLRAISTAPNATLKRRLNESDEPATTILKKRARPTAAKTPVNSQKTTSSRLDAPDNANKLIPESTRPSAPIASLFPQPINGQPQYTTSPSLPSQSNTQKSLALKAAVIDLTLSSPPKRHSQRGGVLINNHPSSSPPSPSASSKPPRKSKEPVDQPGGPVRHGTNLSRYRYNPTAPKAPTLIETRLSKFRYDPNASKKAPNLPTRSKEPQLTGSRLSASAGGHHDELIDLCSSPPPSPSTAPDPPPSSSLPIRVHATQAATTPARDETVALADVPTRRDVPERSNGDDSLFPTPISTSSCAPSPTSSDIPPKSPKKRTKKKKKTKASFPEPATPATKRKKTRNAHQLEKREIYQAGLEKKKRERSRLPPVDAPLPPTSHSNPSDQCHAEPSSPGLINTLNDCYILTLVQLLYPERSQLPHIHPCDCDPDSVPCALRLLFLEMESRPGGVVDPAHFRRACKRAGWVFDVQYDPCDILQWLFKQLNGELAPSVVLQSAEVCGQCSQPFVRDAWLEFITPDLKHQDDPSRIPSIQELANEWVQKEAKFPMFAREARCSHGRDFEPSVIQSLGDHLFLTIPRASGSDALTVYTPVDINATLELAIPASAGTVAQEWLGYPVAIISLHRNSGLDHPYYGLCREGECSGSITRYFSYLSDFFFLIFGRLFPLQIPPSDSKKVRLRKGIARHRLSNGVVMCGGTRGWDLSGFETLPPSNQTLATTQVSGQHRNNISILYICSRSSSAKKRNIHSILGISPPHCRGGLEDNTAHITRSIPQPATLDRPSSTSYAPTATA